MNKIIKLALVDDDAFFVEVLRGYIQPYKDVKIAIEASNGRQLINILEKKKQKLDVILLDLDMPDMDGMETIQYLTVNYPHIKILILTVHDDDAIFNYLIKNGANGFLSKESDMNKVIDAIRIVYKYKYFTDWDLKKTVAPKKSKYKKI
jgi:two-component system response regulator DegU